MATREGGSVRYDPEGRAKRLGPALKYSRYGLEIRLLYGDFEFFVDRSGEGFIPYLQAGRLNLALGMPLAAFGHRRRLVEEYLWFCKRRGRVPAFFPVTKGFFDGLEDLGFGAVKAGVAGTIQLQRFDPFDASFASLRQALGRMRSEAVTRDVVEGQHLDSVTLRDMADLAAVGRTGEARRGAARFLDAQPLACAEHKRFVVARSPERLLGYATLVQGAKPGVWGIETVVGDAPESNVWDFLWMEAISRLKTEGAAELHLGVVPLMFTPGAGGPAAPGEAEWMGAMLRWWFGHAPSLAWARALYRQQLRFRPHTMETQYMVFHPAVPRPEVVAGLMAGLFDGFDLTGLTAEWWRGWLSRLPGARNDMKNEMTN